MLRAHSFSSEFSIWVLTSNLDFISFSSTVILSSSLALWFAWIIGEVICQKNVLTPQLHCRSLYIPKCMPLSPAVLHLLFHWCCTITDLQSLAETLKLAALHSQVPPQTNSTQSCWGKKRSFEYLQVIIMFSWNWELCMCSRHDIAFITLCLSLAWPWAKSNLCVHVEVILRQVQRPAASLANNKGYPLRVLAASNQLFQDLAVCSKHLLKLM